MIHRLIDQNLNRKKRNSFYMDLILQVTLYASRACVFLYFFIWPLNYFIRFPNLRLLLRDRSRYMTHYIIESYDLYVT